MFGERGKFETASRFNFNFLQTFPFLALPKVMKCSTHRLAHADARSRYPSYSGCKYSYPSPFVSHCESRGCSPYPARFSSSECRSCSADNLERDRFRGTRRRRTDPRGTALSRIVSRLYCRSSRTCHGPPRFRSLALQHVGRSVFCHPVE